MAVETLEGRRLLAGTPVLLGDINKTTDQLDPDGAVQVGSVAYFTGHPSSLAGAELFKTDGTRAGTVLVKDIDSGTGSAPGNLTNVNGTLFFTDSDGVHGREVWKSDGTADGTVQVADLASGYTSSNPGGFTVIGQTLYFTATTSDSVSTRTLFATDGTTAGTVAVTSNGTPLTFVANLTNANGTLLFTATNGSSTGLYRLDATGNAVVVDGLPTNASGFTAFGGAAYFEVAGAFGLPGTTPGGLWRTDGTTAGTQLIRSFDYSTDQYDLNGAGPLTVSGDRLYFTAGSQLGGPAYLWSSDGTAVGTQAIYSSPGLGLGTRLVPVGARSVLFVDTTATAGTEPWVSDGTPAGTTLLVDTVAGSVSGATHFSGAVPVAGGRALFVTAGVAGSAVQIWTTDGTPAGTTSAATLPPTPGNVLAIGSFNGVALLASSASYDYGSLYRSDGTAAGTSEIGASLAGDGDGVKAPPQFFAVGSTVYFTADDGISGNELYKSVTGGAATRVADLAPGSLSSDPTNFVLADDGSFYFTAASAANHSLYRIAPGSSTPQSIFSVAGAIQGVWTVGQQVYFQAFNATANASVLWHYDPVANTVKTVLLNGSPMSATSPVRSGAYLYFGASTATGRLFRVDATAAAIPEVVATIANAQNQVPEPLVGDGKVLFFTVYTTTAGTELWKTDGTAAGTAMVKDLSPGTGGTGFSTSLNPPLLTGGIIYFQATVKGGQPRTYRSDGTAAGTYALSNIAGGTAFTAFGGKVYCVAAAGSSDNTFLYRLNGGSAEQLATVGLGGTSFHPNPYQLVVAGNALYVAGLGGYFSDQVDLYRADAGFTNFQFVTELIPSVGGVLGDFFDAGAFALGVGAGDLYIAMYTPTLGTEPYRLSLGVTASADGSVFTDANDNGVRDTGEAGIAGVTVYVDADGDGVLDAGELSVVTDASGAFSFSELTNTGTATRLRVVPPAGSTQTLPTGGAGFPLTLTAGATNTGKSFGLYTAVTPPPTTATLSGFTFDDTNKDGVYESTETKTSGKTVFLDANNNGKLDTGEKSVTTGTGGVFTFGGLAAGTYHVRRVFPSGYSQSNPLIDVTVTAGQTVSGLTIGSQSGTVPPVNTASISGFAFNDANKNGLYDGTDTLAAGKTVFIDLDDDGVLDANETSVVTDSKGAFGLKNLAAGTYHIRRVFPGGYVESTAGRYLTLTAGQATTGVTIGSKSV